MWERERASVEGACSERGGSVGRYLVEREGVQHREDGVLGYIGRARKMS